MLWTIFTALFILWVVGMLSAYTLGGFIHVLGLLAVATVLIGLVQGRRPVA
ncbi:MAG: lmo0937 family membrane protein [Candidatus Eisenbacteria bacterium]